MIFCKIIADKQLITFKTTSMLDANKITEIYFIIDEFNKEFDKTISSFSLNEKNALKKRNRISTMSNSEVITIMLLFQIVSSVTGWVLSLVSLFIILSKVFYNPKNLKK